MIVWFGYTIADLTCQRGIIQQPKYSKQVGNSFKRTHKVVIFFIKHLNICIFLISNLKESICFNINYHKLLPNVCLQYIIYSLTRKLQC